MEVVIMVKTASINQLCKEKQFRIFIVEYIFAYICKMIFEV